MRRLLILLLLLIVLIGGGLYYTLALPYANYGKEVFINIPPRTGTREIAKLLACWRSHPK